MTEAEEIDETIKELEELFDEVKDYRIRKAIMYLRSQKKTIIYFRGRVRNLLKKN